MERSNGVQPRIQPSHVECYHSSSTKQASETSMPRESGTQVLRQMLSKLWSKISSAAVLLILITIPAGCVSGYSRVAAAIIALGSRCDDPEENFKSSFQYTVVASILQNVFVYSAFPISGWLADTKFGQFKMIYASIWFFWIGIFLFGISCILRFVDSCDEVGYFAGRFVSTLLAIACITIGAIAFFPNILVLIMDQLPDVSSSKLRSYIMWFVWAIYVGFLGDNWMESASQLYPYFIDEWFYLTIVIGFAVFSAFLIALFFQRHKFLLPLSHTNPYSTVYKICCFVRKHKVPLRRSAFTYCEDKLPGRLDIAKDKYGGPFTHENVEDVKTLIRILLLFLSLLPYFVGYAAPLSQLNSYVSHFSIQTTTDVFGYLSIYPVHTFLTVILIPAVQLVLIPLFPKLEYFLNNTLRLLLVACLFLFMSNASITVMAGIIGSPYNNSKCFFHYSRDPEPLSFPYQWLFVPAFLWGIGEFLMSTSIMAFICSQSPYSMRGMLIGMFMFSQGLFTSFGTVIAFIFSQFEPVLISCGFLYWLSMTVISLLGCAVFGVASRLYKKRVREEVFDNRGYIESVYDKEIAIGAKLTAMFGDDDSDISESYTLPS